MAVNAIEGGPKFSLGSIVMTKAVHDTGFNPRDLLRRHLQGDWGDVCKDDAKQNEWALENDERLMSVYKNVPELMSYQNVIWIITERDRSVTTVLFPDDY